MGGVFGCRGPIRPERCSKVGIFWEGEVEERGVNF